MSDDRTVTLWIAWEGPLVFSEADVALRTARAMSGRNRAEPDAGAWRIALDQLTKRGTQSQGAYRKAWCDHLALHPDAEGVEWVSPKRRDESPSRTYRGKAPKTQAGGSTTWVEDKRDPIAKALDTREDDLRGLAPSEHERRAHVLRNTHRALHHALTGDTTGETITGCSWCRRAGISPVDRVTMRLVFKGHQGPVGPPLTIAFDDGLDSE